MAHYQLAFAESFKGKAYLYKLNSLATVRSTLNELSYGKTDFCGDATELIFVIMWLLILCITDVTFFNMLYG